MGDSLRIHYTVRQKPKLNFNVCHRHAAKTWRTVRHVCVFCRAVGCLCGTVCSVCEPAARFESSSAHGKRPARTRVRAGVRLGVCGSLRFSGFFKCTSRSPQSSLGRMGRCNTSAVAAPNSGTAPQFNQSSSLNWTVSHVSTLGGIKHPSMKRKLSTCGKCVICNHFYLTNVLFPG